MQTSATAREPETLGPNDVEHSTPKRAAKTAPKPSKQTPMEKLRAELEVMKRRLKAHEKHEREGKQLAAEVESCEMEVESCKSETGAAKQRLADAQNALASFVRNEVPKDPTTGKQQTFIPPGEKPKGEAPPLIGAFEHGKVAFRDQKTLAQNPHKDGADKAEWAAGFLAESWSKCETHDGLKWAMTPAALMDALQPGDALPAGTKQQVKAVHFMEFPWIVADSWKRQTGSTYWACVPLVDLDYWKVTFAKEYGEALGDRAESLEEKLQRQRGGIDCGRIVKVGRKTYAVAPRIRALVLSTPPVKAEAPKPAAAAAKPDAKARAANDAHDEDDDSNE